MKLYLSIALPVALTLSACSGTGASHDPVLLEQPSKAYHADLDHCRHLAKSQPLWNPETRTKAALGATVGALAGAGEASGNRADEMLVGAVVGAVTGTAIGAADTRHVRQRVLLQCLQGRGHKVSG